MMDKRGLLFFSEFGKENAPSITGLFSDVSYPEAEIIADYLENCGEMTVTAVTFATDRITGDVILPPKALSIKTNDDYDWSSDLPYYIRKYNMRLPVNYEKDILRRVKNGEAHV